MQLTMRDPNYTVTMNHGVTLAFTNKPSDDIRSMLKANGYRWQPQSATWYKRSCLGAADFLAALDRRLEPKRPDGLPTKPHGKCWGCGSDGWFRPQGASCPVLCDACHTANV